MVTYLFLDYSVFSQNTYVKTLNPIKCTQTCNEKQHPMPIRKFPKGKKQPLRNDMDKDV